MAYSEFMCACANAFAITIKIDEEDKAKEQIKKKSSQHNNTPKKKIENEHAEKLLRIDRNRWTNVFKCEDRAKAKMKNKIEFFIAAVVVVFTRFSLFFFALLSFRYFSISRFTNVYFFFCFSHSIVFSFRFAFFSL